MTVEIKNARRIAVVSGKGGVGKTVITANLAASLSSFGRRVLVVDADLGLANLDIILGVDPQFTLLDFLHGTQPLEKVLLNTHKGFDLIPAGSGLLEGTVLTPAMSENIESIFDSLEQRYDVILFDAGAGVGDVVMFFANLAHEIIVVVTPEPTSLMDAYATIKILHQFHERRRILLVVNHADPEITVQIGEAVANHLQNVISRFLGENCPQITLIGSLPEDPEIPSAIKQRQLLSEINPQASSISLINNIASFFMPSADN
jgi:flagellar biosynthesis protein FlhG